MENKETVVIDAFKKFIVFRLGVEHFGIDIQYVQNIVRMMPITRVPRSDNYIKGVVNLRGDIIPVMSVRLKFKLEDDDVCDETRIVFIEADGIAIGLIVDEVKEVVQISGENIEISSQDFSEEKDHYADGLCKVGDALVTLLNVEALMRVKNIVEC